MKTLQQSKKVKISDVPPMVPSKLKYISMQILMALFSFIFAACKSFFGLAPFGVAFCASVKKKYLFVSVIGSCIGYIVSQDGIFALRYIACNLCIAIVLGSLHHVIKFENEAPANTLRLK